MKKILALVLAAMMALALCACGSSGDTEEAAPVDEAEPAVNVQADASVPGSDAAEGDLEAYKTYVIAYAAAGAPDEEEAANVEALVNACTTAEEIEAISQLTVLYENAGVLTYDEWVAAGCPEADTSSMVAGDPNAGASGEGSGEPSGEAPAE